MWLRGQISGRGQRRLTEIFNLKRKTQLAILSRELAMLLQAGLTIQDALGVLMESHSVFKQALAEVERSVSHGLRLSEALFKQAETFGQLYGKTVALGEETGGMVKVFDLLADWQEREARIVGKTVNALIYPAFVVLVAGLGGFFFSLSCLPLLKEVLGDLGGTLPGATQALITVVGTLLHPATWLVAFLLVGLWMTYLHTWLKSDQGRHDFEELLRNLPVVGVLVRDISLARVFISLNLTTGVGLDLVKAFRVSAETSGSRVLAKDMKMLGEAIAEGMCIHEYLETRPTLYPKDVVGLICVGEESAKLDRCFLHLARYYEREVEYRIASFLAMLEPMLTGLVSLFVGAVILALILPISSVLQQL